MSLCFFCNQNKRIRKEMTGIPKSMHQKKCFWYATRGTFTAHIETSYIMKPVPLSRSSSHGGLNSESINTLQASWNCKSPDLGHWILDNSQGPWFIVCGFRGPKTQDPEIVQKFLGMRWLDKPQNHRLEKESQILPYTYISIPHDSP